MADKLELTNSVVSKRIGRLEEAMNVQLLYRTTRKLSLTDAGQALYGKARLAREALIDAQNSVTGYGDAVQGKIRVTAPAVSSKLVLSEAIASFCQQYPEVEVELSVTNRFIDLIDDGYDLAIRTAHLEDSSLVARRLVDSHWMICASPCYLASEGRPSHPSELSQHNCLIYKYEGGGAETWQFKEANRAFSVQVNGRFQTNNLDALKQAALADFGLAYLPRALIHDALTKGDLVGVLEDYVNKDLGIYAVYPKTRQPDKKLSLLVEHFRQALLDKEAYFH